MGITTNSYRCLNNFIIFEYQHRHSLSMKLNFWRFLNVISFYIQRRFLLPKYIKGRCLFCSVRSPNFRLLNKTVKKYNHQVQFVLDGFFVFCCKIFLKYFTFYLEN